MGLIDRIDVIAKYGVAFTKSFWGRRSKISAASYL